MENKGVLLYENPLSCEEDIRGFVLERKAGSRKSENVKIIPPMLKMYDFFTVKIFV